MEIEINRNTANEFGQFTNNYSLEGEKLEVITYPNPVLTKKAVDVTEFNEELNTLAKNMFYTMYRSPGIGLAAPQIGKSINLLVMDIDYDRELHSKSTGKTQYQYSNFNPKIFINPKIVEKNGEQLHEEGCLSLPGIYEEVKRFENITVEYQDLNGEQQKIEAKDMLSVCIQHEMDHLEGIVFIDRLSAFKKSFYKKRLLKEAKRLKS